MFNLYVEPSLPPVEWRSFLSNKWPSHSIALDGYVKGGPKFSLKEMKVNFNHHEDVDRLATRATCAQVLMAIRQGLFSSFRNSDGIKVNIFTQDCDEDVCTSVFLLKNSHLVENAMNPAINRLVYAEDMLDSTAGAYPFPVDLPLLQELAWIFAPYREARLAGTLEQKKASNYRAIIEDVEMRISRYVLGKGESIPLDTRFERIGGGSKWALVKEIGAQARTGIFAAGIKIFLSVKERSDGNLSVIIGKLSPFVNLNLKSLARELNSLENCSDDTWGGADNVIGSPRISGTKLKLDIISEQLEETLNEGMNVVYFSNVTF